MAGIYVHFPFCSGRCIYCDFYSRAGRNDWMEYVGALTAEAEANRDFFGGVLPATLYFGGGTPSLLPPDGLERVAAAVREAFGTGSFEEFTIEANPDNVTPENAAAWAAMGVTRVSMGVQSFDDSHLKWMKRRHSGAQAEEAVSVLREAGIGDVSIDLIFGFTGLSQRQWDDNVSKAVALRPEHISCYQMTGRYADPSEELCLSQYLHLQQRFGEEGYEQYEVSNYCLPGHASRHNSSYWDRSQYLGLGAAAHSFDGCRVRRWNVADIDRYMAGEAPSSETLTEDECAEETVMLSLRTVRGLDLETLPDGWRDKMKPALERMSKAGYILWSGSHVSIPKDKLFVSDWIVEQLCV